MKALLLAAGLGERLKPVTLTTPKCLVEIGGQALLDHWLRSLNAAERFEQIFINTHYLVDKVCEFIRRSPHSERVHLIYEPRLLGTAGTLRNLQDILQEDDFLVAHADNLSVIDWPRFLDAHHNRPKHSLGTMMTFYTDAPKSSGIVELDHDKTLIQMHEKTSLHPGNLANAAVYLFSPSVFGVLRACSPTGPLDISRDLIPRLHGRITTFLNDIYHRDIGTPDSLTKARSDFTRLFNVAKGSTS